MKVIKENNEIAKFTCLEGEIAFILIPHTNKIQNLGTWIQQIEQGNFFSREHQDNIKVLCKMGDLNLKCVINTQAQIGYMAILPT